MQCSGRYDGLKNTLAFVATLVIDAVYRIQKDLHEAEVTTQRTIEMLEEGLGSVSTGALPSICDLGKIQEEQGKMKNAEASYNRTLQSYKQMNCSPDGLMLDVLERLAGLYHIRGKIRECENMYK